MKCLLQRARMQYYYGGDYADYALVEGGYAPDSVARSHDDPRAITKEAYALAKQGQVVVALSLLEQHEAAIRTELDFWKCYIHCLFKLTKQDYGTAAQNEAWWAAFEQRMQMLEHNSTEACRNSSLEQALSGTSSFDQYIVKSLASLRTMRSQHIMPNMAVNPRQAALLQEAKGAAKSGEQRKALALYQEAMTLGPLPENDLTSVEWCLYRIIKEERSAARVQLKDITALFNLYLKCCPEPKPGQLHSLMLIHLSRICDGINTQNDPQKETNQHFYGAVEFPGGLLLKQMDVLNSVQDEDLYSSHGEDGTTYEPMVVRLVRGVTKLELNRFKQLHKKIMNGEFSGFSSEQLELMSYLAKVITKYRRYDQSDYSIWLDYYQAQLLYFAQHYDEAITSVQPVVQQKSREYWIWSFLGQCYGNLSSQHRDQFMVKSAQCFAQAIMCRPQSSALAQLYKYCAWSLQRLGYDAVAQFLSAEAAKEEPWVPQTGKTRLWVGPIAPQAGAKSGQDFAAPDSAAAQDAAQELLTALASEASAQLFGELSWYRANMGESFTQKRPNSEQSDAGKFKDRPRRTLLVEYPGYELPLKLTMNDESLFKQLPLGAPVEARIERNGTDAKGAPRFDVRQLRLRSSENATPWDLLPVRALVITRVDAETRKYHFRYNRDLHGTLPFNLLKIKKGLERFELPLKPGDVFSARLVAQPRASFVASICLDATYPTDKKPEPEAFKYVHRDEDKVSAVTSFRDEAASGTDAGDCDDVAPWHVDA